MLGVPVTTLRSWHQRYGVALPVRTPGGHRRYEQPQLMALQALNSAIANGIAPRTAAQVLREPRGDVQLPLELLTELLGAATAGDSDAFRALLDRGQERLGLDDAVQRLLIPALQELGVRWSLQQIDVAQEHLATQAARGWIAQRGHGVQPHRRAAPVLLAAAAGNEHTVALEAFELLLRLRGWPTRLLGASTPTASLLSCVEVTSAQAVVLTAHQASRSRAAVAALGALGGQGSVALYYAGAAFDSPRRRAAVPGTYLGTSLPSAADLMSEQLSEMS